jgi:hypothetical protein
MRAPATVILLLMVTLPYFGTQLIVQKLGKSPEAAKEVAVLVTIGFWLLFIAVVSPIPTPHQPSVTMSY